ncbi:MAG: hypothetical protein FRX49_01301 [Trebouxia sp. A1-2]|nr:MAG: hypothetical protein FRX49_01301 [Trebouxia sp. A1-2]
MQMLHQPWVKYKVRSILTSIEAASSKEAVMWTGYTSVAYGSFSNRLDTSTSTFAPRPQPDGSRSPSCETEPDTYQISALHGNTVRDFDTGSIARPHRSYITKVIVPRASPMSSLVT